MTNIPTSEDNVRMYDIHSLAERHINREAWPCLSIYRIVENCFSRLELQKSMSQRVVLPDNRVITYQIDARGRRIGKKVDGVFEYGFIYGDQLNPIAKVDESGNIIESYIYGLKSNIPEYLIKDDKKYKIISNHLGSPIMVLGGQVQDLPVLQMKYDSFGNIIEENGDFEIPFGFAGGIWDKDTKLTRFGVRDYDSETGRWTSKEPLGFDGSRNFYVYVGNDGGNYVDLDGLRTIVWIWHYDSFFSLGKYGHVNISINQQMYDFTGDGFKVYNLDEYLSKQKRSADLINLDLTIYEELKLLNKLYRNNSDQDYGLFFNSKDGEFVDFTCIDSVRKSLYELYDERNDKIYNIPDYKNGVKFPSNFLEELLDTGIEFRGIQMFGGF